MSEVKSSGVSPKKRGRQPMTPEEREAAAKRRAAEKEKAANLKPELFLQYHDCDMNMAALVEAAKAVKPEERMAYYVVNGDYEGQVSF